MRSMLEIINDPNVSDDEIRLVFNHTVSYKDTERSWLDLTKIIVGIIGQATQARNFAVVKYMQQRFCVERPYDLRDEFDLVFDFSDSFYHFRKVNTISYCNPNKTNPNYNLQNAFLNAAQTGQLDILQSLYSERHLNQIDINQTVNEEGNTALMLAAQAGHLSIIRFLIKNGADWSVQVNKKDAFWYAEVSRRNGIIDYLAPLYCAGNDIAATSTFQEDVLGLIENACLQNDSAKVKQWLDILKPFLVKKNMLADIYLKTVEKGCLDALRVLHSANNVDVNACFNSLGRTPLMIAARNSHHKLMEFLLENGASLDVKNEKSAVTVFYYAPKGSKTLIILMKHKEKLSLANIIKDKHVSQSNINRLFSRHIYNNFGLTISAKDLVSEIEVTKKHAKEAGNKPLIDNMNGRLKKCFSMA